MTRRDWWLGIAAVVAALCLHALVPRHTFRAMPGEPFALIRVDRWTGRAVVGVFRAGTWTLGEHTSPEPSR